MHTKLLLLLLASSCFLNAQTPAPAAKKPEPPKAYSDPAQTDEDYAIQGEYAGMAGDKKIGAQIIALGDGKFEAVGYIGGLPGAGWDGDRTEVKRVKGERKAGQQAVAFTTELVGAVVDGKKITVTAATGEKVAELTRVERASPTIGAQPPAGALVMFGGKDTNKFPNSKVTDDGLLQEGVTSADTFMDFSIHIEFRLPYMPFARGQGRGNSGIYLQGRYEVQMLDSFGLEGKNNECGGIYTISDPKVNMCLPPLVWQTYDIDFTAAKFDADGKKTANARATVKHNGVIVQDNVDLTHATTASPLKEGGVAGPIHLQNHGTPVRYRNVWVVTK